MGKGPNTEPPSSAPLGQFLSNGTENIVKQEQQVSAKLDKLNDIAIPKPKPGDKSDPKRADDSIVHLLNSDDYALPMPDNTTTGDYYDPDDPGMSPPVNLIPEGAKIPSPERTPQPDEPLPYSRPADSDDGGTPPAPDLATTPEGKKTINLQTYLKRKKDDDIPSSQDSTKPHSR